MWCGVLKNIQTFFLNFIFEKEALSLLQKKNSKSTSQPIVSYKKIVPKFVDWANHSDRT